jgi:energy-coupling factor transport system ATP-binding protein
MLDPIGRAEVMKTITRINRDNGVTVVLITHHMEEAAQCGRVVVMNSGEIIADGTPEQVFSQVALLHGAGLAAPQTVELCNQLRQKGLALPLDRLDVDSCAEVIAEALRGNA